GYGAEMTTNGVEAMSALERAVFDVVLMDVQMPEMDGLEAARRIRRTFALGDRPRVIAMTAHALQGDRERCFEAGMDDYLTKPLDLHALSEALERSAPLARSQDREPVGATVAASGAGSSRGDEVAPGDRAVPSRAGAEGSAFGRAVDPTVLAGFAEQLGEGGEEVLQEIVAVFLDDAPSVIEEQRAAAAASDWPTLDRAAHTLK